MKHINQFIILLTTNWIFSQRIAWCFEISVNSTSDPFLLGILSLPYSNEKSGDETAAENEKTQTTSKRSNAKEILSFLKFEELLKDQNTLSPSKYEEKNVNNFMNFLMNANSTIIEKSHSTESTNQVRQALLPSELPTTRIPTYRPIAPLTLTPSFQPTVRVTEIPTASPTLFPTQPPTLTPTMSPTIDPTSTPTHFPSLTPSTTPTLYPSLSPSLTPSSSFLPSALPSQAPTISKLPTLEPTFSPTIIPTFSPTLKPTFSPTLIPTFSPTLKPTNLPTSTPTISPTTSPTSLPSLSVFPSTMPTSTPSISPSSLPSSIPSYSPSRIPSHLPSSTPSSSPSYELQSYIINDVAMEFDDCASLYDEAIQVWQDVTSSHIKSSILSSEENIAVLNVTTVLTLQDDEPLILNETNRFLQVNQPLWILFNVYASLRSEEYNHDMSQYIAQAFDAQTEEDAYIAALQSQLRIFSTINSVNTFIDGTLVKEAATNPVEEQIPETNQDKTNIVGISVGTVLAILLLCCVAACICWRKRSYLNDLKYEDEEDDQEPQGRNANYINVQHHEEVSTLGEPTMVGTVDKDTTMSVDYDYTGAFGGAGPSVVSTSGATGSKSSIEQLTLLGELPDEASSTNASTSTDQHSFEFLKEDSARIIVVDAPSGKLGVVIDAPNGASPTVYSIKPTSPLRDQILVGDKLISIDGQDTTQLSASGVQKIIGAKANSSNRQLVFLRTISR